MSFVLSEHPLKGGITPFIRKNGSADVRTVVNVRAGTLVMPNDNSGAQNLIVRFALQIVRNFNTLTTNQAVI